MGRILLRFVGFSYQVSHKPRDSWSMSSFSLFYDPPLFMPLIQISPAKTSLVTIYLMASYP